MDGGWLWQLNRYQYDTLRKYDPENLQVPVAEVSLASDVGSSNPHDVAYVATNSSSLYTAKIEYRYWIKPLLNRSTTSTYHSGQMQMGQQRPPVWWLSMTNSMLDYKD